VTVLAAGLLAAALAASWAVRRWPIRAGTSLNARGAGSWTLALQLGVLLSTTAVLLLVKNVAADDRVWTWPYLNKRWLIALYLIAVATLVVFPVIFEWWRAPGRSVRARDAPATASARRWTASIPGLIAIVALAWWFAGPPWHLERHHRGVESHEQAHLGPLQAIDKGYLPYIGPASTQYGPGSQWLIYHVMRLRGPFDIVSFRTAWAVFNFAALAAVAVAAYFWLGLASAAAVVALAVLYSPFAFYGTDADGTLAGMYGWGNALRYIAPVLVVPALVRACGVEGCPPPRSAAWTIALGIAWGAASWVSQENLSSTLLAAGLLLVLLCGTQSVPIGRALRVGRDLAIGFAIGIAPALIYYASHGALTAAIHNYFVVPQAVAAGYSNTWWPAGNTAPRTFYAAAPFMIALAIAALWRRPIPTLQTPLDSRRALFLAFVSVQLVCFQVALLRSDSMHLQNTMIALPFVLAIGARDLPRWLASSHTGRQSVRIAFILAALAIFPSGRLKIWREIFLTPYHRFVSGDPRSRTAAPDGRVAYARATPLLAAEPSFAPGSSMSMQAFLDFADDVHHIVGARRTYIGDLGEVWTGPLYFFADLTPAPYPLDRETMMVNDWLQQQAVEDIRAHPADYECFIGVALDAPDARAFGDTHPGAERVDRTLGTRTVHILLSRPNP
jgi:hypothetical protein